MKFYTLTPASSLYIYLINACFVVTTLVTILLFSLINGSSNSNSLSSGNSNNTKEITLVNNTRQEILPNR
jgi:hypothetical protein